ncbi:hypothetical protein RQP46_004092 [Phenoliferia psychrophenolica]
MGGASRGRNQAGADYAGRSAASRAAVIGHSDGAEDDLIDHSAPIGFLAARGTTRAKKLPHKSKKCLIILPAFGLVTLVISVVLLVFPILRAVAVHTLSVSVLSVTASNITSPTNNSFGLTLEGQAHKVGVFPARLSFKNPLDVYWIAPENLTNEMHLGHFRMDYIGVAAGHGRIKQETMFYIDNVEGFARFSEYLITQEVFTWRLKSEEVTAQAFGFIPAHGLSFTKDLTLPGMANMTDVSISDFQLPGDDPAGGISLAVTTKLTNPSAFGIEIGTLIVDLYYGDLYLGPAQTAHPINLTSGVNHINLVGRLLPYTDDPVALAKLSTVFSNYLNGEVTMTQARGRSVTQPNGDSIAWLQQGIQALTLNVPLSSPTGRISPINSITIEALSLAFDPSAPYSPMSNSSQVSATFGLPFGFSLNIVQLSNQFEIISNRTAVAGLSAPLGMSQTTILTQNAGYTTGGITLDLPLSPLTIGPSYTEHLAFDQFTYDLTTTNGSKFILNGNTSAVTNTPLGQVKLTNIGFTVPAGLIGLESLSTYPTEIISVDVIGGTTEGIVLAITVGLTNPSNLDLKVGNVTFQLFSGDSYLGTATLPDLHLTQGYQEHPSISVFEANGNAGALQTLTDFTSGTNSALTISGFNGSSQTESLTQAFMALHLNATLKGLGTKLLNYANLTVLPTTGVTNSVASSIVSLENPFTSDLSITNIQSNITHSSGLFVGSIVTPTDFLAKGHTANISPVLDFNLNLYPPDIFTLLRVLAGEAGLPTDQIDGIVKLGGYSYVNTTGTPSLVKRNELDTGADSIPLALGYESFVGEALSKRELQKRNIYSGFDLPSFVLTAFASLKVDVALVSVLHIGDFTTNLAYSQANVPAYTDSTLTLLLPILARPIVQRIVDESILGVSTVLITDPLENSFMTQLVGAITNAGPFDAVITFTKGLTVAWNGAPLGQIAMPNVTLVGDLGAQLNIAAAFAVADVPHLTDFTGYLLTEPSFVWQIYGEELEVTALGITVGGISISKDVVLDGMNGFKNGVIIDSFDLPANDPAGGVSLTLATTLINPSSVGMALSGIAFSNSFGETVIGPAAAAGAFVLAPKATIALPLVGRLIPQTTPAGLQDVSTIFNGFIHGLPSNLIVQGVSAGPFDVSWLNTGIKKLAIAVVLPAMKLDVINSITINQMTLMFTEENAYSPAFSTNDTVALFQLPFAFPVNIVQAATSITATNSNTAPASRLGKRDTGDFATLDVPMLPSTTDVQARSLLLKFEDIPFTSIDNGIFSSFLMETTVGATKPFALHGAANTITRTAIGDLALSDIAFSVETAVEGLQGLNAQPATVSDLDVFHGYPGYLQINANAHLFNPSPQITIGTGNVNFGLTFQGQTIGSAIITGLVLVPGANLVPTAVHYSPSGSSQLASGQVLLENFIQGIVSDTIIVGSRDTTPIASLKEALASIQLGTSIPPLQGNLVTQANLAFPLDIAKTGIADATITLANPFTANIYIDSVVTLATYQGISLGKVDVPRLSPPIFAAGHTQIVSNVLPLALDTDPKVLIAFVEAAALAQGVDLGILLPEFAYVLSLESTASTVTTSVNLQPETCTPSGTTAKVQALILAAVKNLKTNLTISSATRLDEFSTPLNFVQNNVPTVLDDSVLYLTGILGKTIVSNIVDQSVLAFASGMVTNVTDGGFTVALQGSLLNAGPFDALIEFPEPVVVVWDGTHIADIVLPPICATGGAGVPNLASTGILTIKDLSRFTDFAAYLLLNPKFTWTISTDKLRVTALGTIFDNVVLSKQVSFDAFNRLEPGVTISKSDFPSDASNGINLALTSLIPSPSNLGIELGAVSFDSFFQGSPIGPVNAEGLILLPKSVTTAPLTGVITYRDDTAGLDALGTVFSQFLQGKDTSLTVTGVSVTSPAQPGRPVNWLSAAFKQFTFEVILPGKMYDIISSVALRDLTVTVAEPSQAFAALVTNNVTNVVYKNPFGFSLQAIDAGGAFIINYNNLDSALLTLPKLPSVFAETSTGQDAALTISIPTPATLASLDNGGYANFFSAITNDANAVFNLHGAAEVTARTKAGDIPISGIPFSVTSSFPGIGGFGGVATVPHVPVVIGSGSGNPFSPSPGGQFVRIQLSVVLSNPAPLILHTNMISFAVIYQGVFVGRAYVNPLDLLPGSNTVPSEFQYQPVNAGDPIGQGVLGAYLMTAGDIPLTVAGDLNSSPYGSLQTGLSHVSLSAPFPGQGIPLVHDIIIYIDVVKVICTSMAAFSFRLNNHLDTSITLLGVKGTGSNSGTQYAQFDYTLKEPFRTTAGQAPGSYGEEVPTSLPAGQLQSLALFLPENQAKGLDIDIVNSVLIDQYHALSLPYRQSAVPYTIVTTIGKASLNPDDLQNQPINNIRDLIIGIAGITQCIPDGAGGNSLSVVSSAASDIAAILSELNNVAPGLGLPTGIRAPAVPSAASSVFNSLIADGTSLVGGLLGGGAQPTTTSSPAPANVATPAAPASGRPQTTTAVQPVTTPVPIVPGIVAAGSKRDGIPGSPDREQIKRLLAKHNVRAVGGDL